MQSLAEAPNDRQTVVMRHAVLNTCGFALYRAGRYREAIRCIEESLTLKRPSGFHDWIVLALAYERLGAREDAEAYLARARKGAPKASKRGPWNRLEVELLLREAEMFS